MSRMKTNDLVPTQRQKDGGSFPNENDVEKDSLLVSSAASCLTLTLLGNTFLPVYTHQLFDGEHIRGYEPTPEQMNIVKDMNDEIISKNTWIRSKDFPFHSSFHHHETVTHCLHVSILLAPSCRVCQIDIDLREKKVAIVEGEETQKNGTNNGDIKNRQKNINIAKTIYKSINAKKRKLGNSKKQIEDSETDSQTNIEEEELESDSGSDSNYSDSRTGQDTQTDDDEVELDGTNYTFEDNDDVVEKDQPIPLGTRRFITIDEIQTQLDKALPHRRVTSTKVKPKPADQKDQTSESIRTRSKDLESIPVEEDYLSSPIGNLLHEYSPDDDAHQSQYIITLADGSSPVTQQYHNQVQHLALWYIETADTVDFLTDEGGFWKVLYIFQKHPHTNDNQSNHKHHNNRKNNNENNMKHNKSKESFKYSFVGYTTLFYFHSPFKKPKGGQILRICQSLVLVPYQRSGHGTQMIKQVYKLIKEQREIVEINVEDPAPAFVRLRDKLDFQLIMSQFETILPVKYACEGIFHALPENDAVRIASKLKITSKQVHRAYEMLKFCQCEVGNEEMEKQYRIMVKKRLLKYCKEELSACGDKEKQKVRLGEFFDNLLLHYTDIVRHHRKGS